MDDHQIRIAASDVADYVYCRRCFFFRLRGLLPAKGVTEAMRRGAAQHTHLATDLEHHTATRTIVLVVVAIAALLCALLIVLGVILH
jgi:hypothetical protein